MASSRRLTAQERQRERALLYTLIADIAIVGVIAVVAVASGSLTMGAELIRTVLMVALEVFSFVAMWRIHRGRFADFEFGHGKIEQLANLGIAVGLLVGGGLVLTGSITALTGTPQVLSPLGLAFAASVAAINTSENFLAWYAMRRAAKAEANAILTSQMRARWVKLVSAVVVQLALTIAAITYDTLVAHWLDGLGAIFVGCFMILTAVGMFREGLPDLLDKGLDEAAHLAILRALSAHDESYTLFHGVRTRSSSGHMFVEVELGYPKDLPLEEIDRRRMALEKSFHEELGPCDITVKVRGAAVSPAS
ncbi:MAG: cation diffusion facilitator family transporter [Rhodospirillales bacterium]